MEDHGDKGGLFLLGTGIDKIQAPSHSWKRRYILIWKLGFFLAFVNYSAVYCWEILL
jgi:hypothetical protein